ncbi:hypothetical protein CRYUN_Cryun35bG0001200 [Craigia yunnanensis]
MAYQSISGPSSDLSSSSGFQYMNSPFGDTTYTKIFVGGLAWETQSETMRHYFEQFGEILEAVVITDKNTGRSKGYGFVTFQDPEAARRACADPTPIIDGRRANSNLASLGRPRPAVPYGIISNLSGRLRPASPCIEGVQATQGAYVGSFGYQPPLSYSYQQGLTYPSYGFATYRPEYVYPQGLYNPYAAQQYLQIYRVPGAANTAIYPYGQLGQTVPRGHGYTAVQGYAMPNHQIMQFGGPSANVITTSPMPTIQTPYPGAGKSPVKEAASSDSTPKPNQFKPPQISTKFTTPPVKSEILSTPTSRPPPSQPSSIDADVIHVPSYSHSCEVRFLPEFFNGRSPSKSPNLYMYYRNSIIKQFRENLSRKISFTDARRTLVGDVGSIRRVFDFLDLWGLINYSASSAPSKHAKDTANNNKSADAPSLESPSAAPNSKNSSTTRRFCGACKSLCTIACFVCDNYDSTLCARCYVRGNFRVGLCNADFRRVEITDEAKADWSEKETLLLLEALMHYGDDWKKVARHVGGRTDKDCVAHFIKLPFREEFLGDPYSNEAESGFETYKRMRLTPLADASNPIMAQAAFLSALAGGEIAEAAARAAVTTLSRVYDTTASKGGCGSLARNTRREADISAGGTNLNELERTYADVNSVLEKEEGDIERAITGITEVQMREIQHKIVQFEEVDLLMEKEWQELEAMKNLLFIDQLNLSFSKSYALKTEERVVENVRADVL